MQYSRKPVFSGHETFQCRHLWLKKGYDFVAEGKSFSADDAVVDLGVGKNMVNSVRYWLRAFNVLNDENQLTEFAHAMFNDEASYDPYLEDDASLWLLHYQLVKKGFSTSYFLIFNELRKERIEFTEDHFVHFVKGKAESVMSFQSNSNTLKSDFEVFHKLYVGTESKDKEDVISGVLTELSLVRTFNREGNKSTFYHIPDTEKSEIPGAVLLYAILDNEQYGMSVNFESLMTGYNSVGSIFAINRTGLLNKIETLVQQYDWLVFKDDAGIKELQFKTKPEAFTVLDEYYG